MKNIPEKQLKILFQRVTSFYKGSSHPERIFFKVVKNTSKDQEREINNVVKQYYAGWYKTYGGVGVVPNNEFYIVFYNKDHCQLAFDDLTAQHRKYMESDAYSSPSSPTDDEAVSDYSEVDDYPTGGDYPTGDSESTGAQRKTLLVVAAIAVVAVLAVLLWK